MASASKTSGTEADLTATLYILPNNTLESKTIRYDATRQKLYAIFPHYNGSRMLLPASDTLHVGDAAPEFSLPAFDRTTVRLSDFKGKPTVVVFIRGTW
jgi:hypothetical protein